MNTPNPQASEARGFIVSELRAAAARGLGAEWAAMLDDGALLDCMRDATTGSERLTAEDVAVARAALFVVTGSALLAGERKAFPRDAAALYGLAIRANNLLIGKLHGGRK